MQKYSIRAALALATIAVTACTSLVTPAPTQSASATPSAPNPTATGFEGTTCGKLFNYVTGPKHAVTLEVGSTRGIVYVEYILVGSGPIPSDIASQFAAGVPQTIAVIGRFSSNDPSQPITVTNFEVMRLAEPCPTTQ